TAPASTTGVTTATLNAGVRAARIARWNAAARPRWCSGQITKAVYDLHTGAGFSAWGIRRGRAILSLLSRTPHPVLASEPPLCRNRRSGCLVAMRAVARVADFVLRVFVGALEGVQDRVVGVLGQQAKVRPTPTRAITLGRIKPHTTPGLS